MASTDPHLSNLISHVRDAIDELDKTGWRGTLEGQGHTIILSHNTPRPAAINERVQHPVLLAVDHLHEQMEAYMVYTCEQMNTPVPTKWSIEAKTSTYDPDLLFLIIRDEDKPSDEHTHYRMSLRSQHTPS